MKKRRKLSPGTFINARVTSTVSITFVLFIFGLLILLFLFANKLSHAIKEQLTVDIILSDNITESQIRNLQRKINAAPFSKSTVYISKDEALKNLEPELGENSQGFLDVNPLPSIIQMNLNSEYVHPDSIKVIEQFLSLYPNDITEIEHRKELMQKLNENTTKIGFVLILIIIPLLFISFALISNTIRLMVYSKRFIIYTMQLVGANKSFIRKPFIVSNIWSGLIAGLIAVGLLYWLIYYISNSMVNQIDGLLFDIKTLAIVFGSVILSGVITSILATYLAVNKYISAKVDDLYRM
ncbi:MAG: permease-like cell division protein FtsX [Dysgonamonadaceae bacterium]|jgi:cell division transport system permease protein|nr:permease-like cell division protein FtsX [Dysgonamonadaceae bacterium]